MCIESKHYKGIILSAIGFAIVAQVVHTAGAFLTMSYYTDPAYFPVWSKVMMPSNAAPGMEFYALSLAFGVAAALIYGGAYSVIMKAIPGKDAMCKGLNFGAMLFLIGSVPGSLGMYLLINLPAALIGMWAIENLVISLLGGIIIARMVK